MSLNERKMEFFNLTTFPISSHCSGNWVYLYDDLDIPEPFLSLHYLYQLPKSVDPNSTSSILEILVVKDVNYDISSFHQITYTQ